MVNIGRWKLGQMLSMEIEGTRQRGCLKKLLNIVCDSAIFTIHNKCVSQTKQV